METQRKIDVDKRDRVLIKNLYMGQTASVRIKGADSEPGIIGRGVIVETKISLVFTIIQYLYSELSG